MDEKVVDLFVVFFFSRFLLGLFGVVFYESCCCCRLFFNMLPLVFSDKGTLHDRQNRALVGNPTGATGPSVL